MALSSTFKRRLKKVGTVGVVAAGGVVAAKLARKTKFVKAFKSGFIKSKRRKNNVAATIPARRRLLNRQLFRGAFVKRGTGSGLGGVRVS